MSIVKLQFNGLRPKFGIRNAEFGIKERGQKPAPDASSKGIDNQGFLKSAEAKYRLNLSSSRNSEFRIPNSELNRQPQIYNPNITFKILPHSSQKLSRSTVSVAVICTSPKSCPLQV